VQIVESHSLSRGGVLNVLRRHGAIRRSRGVVIGLVNAVHVLKPGEGGRVVALLGIRGRKTLGQYRRKTFLTELNQRLWYVHRCCMVP
jgi:hypothetical protein